MDSWNQPSKNNFDEIKERRNSKAIKHDFKAKRNIAEDVLPMWVADMDFLSPDCINQSLIERATHGFYGYSDVDASYFSSVQQWFSSQFHLQIKEEHLITTPGVVFAMATAVEAFTQEGDHIIIQRPVYYPFSSVVEHLGRQIVNNPLCYKNKQYEMDFDDFEQKIKMNRVKLFLLCHPHNPVGRVWRVEELKKIVEICQKYNVIIVSDEIHCDFIYPPHQHHMLAVLCPEYQANIITLTAPSKTFNIAGLQIANIFIFNSQWREAFLKVLQKVGYSNPNIMGLVACESGYKNGKPWLEDLLVYLQSNIDLVDSYLKQKMPNVYLIKPQGTYLLWLDFSDLSITEEELSERFLTQGKIWLNKGSLFGQEGNGFWRLNVAAPRKQIENALDRMYKSIKDLL